MVVWYSKHLKSVQAYRYLGVADVRALGDELNRFGVLCMGLPAIPAPGLIPDLPGFAGAGCLVRCTTAVFVR